MDERQPAAFDGFKRVSLFYDDVEAPWREADRPMCHATLAIGQADLTAGG